MSNGVVRWFGFCVGVVCVVVVAVVHRVAVEISATRPAPPPSSVQRAPDAPMPARPLPKLERVEGPKRIIVRDQTPDSPMSQPSVTPVQPVLPPVQ